MKQNKFCNNGTHTWTVTDDIVYCVNCKTIQQFAEGMPKSDKNK